LRARAGTIGVEESMISRAKRRKLPSFYPVPCAFRLDLTGRSLGLTALVNVLRVNYIGILAQTQLPGIE